MAVPPPTRKLSFLMSIALVVGNMIGSGIFLLPKSLAPYGLNSVIGWVLSARGALAVVLSDPRLDLRMRALPFDLRLIKCSLGRRACPALRLAALAQD